MDHIHTGSQELRKTCLEKADLVRTNYETAFDAVKAVALLHVIRQQGVGDAYCKN